MAWTAMVTLLAPFISSKAQTSPSRSLFSCRNMEKSSVKVISNESTGEDLHESANGVNVAPRYRV
ncbi:hypothetical protein C2845_PM05G03070 [Panicum miliaceum]|uniref:Uncharacterized protein n=1 Tax=Panicum miliaceum TaxID=4540 RepID=A0A3L6SY74_PANMI|nr:hypothetical protein C2845_PM05G03070 [Panicum miliaceum]